jgi:hypothetical protein
MDGVLASVLHAAGAAWVAIWLVAIGAGIALGARVLSWWWARDEARTRAFAAEAARLGLDFAATDVLHASWEPFRLLGGPEADVRNVVYGRWAGVDVRAFEYSRARAADDGSARLGVRERFSCCVAPLDASCPLAVIGPAALVARLPEAGALSSVHLESDRFRRRFRLACDDARFATALVDQRMMAWLLTLPERFAFEVREDRILCVADPRGPAQLRLMLDATAGFQRHVPRVVRSLYPPRPLDREADGWRTRTWG